MKPQRIYSVIPVEERLPKLGDYHLCEYGKMFLDNKGKWKTDKFELDKYSPSYWLEGPKERIVLTPEEMRAFAFDWWKRQADSSPFAQRTNLGEINAFNNAYDLYLKSKEQ